VIEEAAMKDQTIKVLLAAIVVLLLLLLVRPSAVTPPALAQFGGSPTASQPAMAANNNLVYVLQGTKLSVFYVDLGLDNPFELLKLLGDDRAQDEVRKKAKLRFLLSQDINQVQADAAKKAP
jgi:hypothetical protein